VCWRTEGAAHAWSGRLLLAALATASAAIPAVAGEANANREGCNEPLCYTASSLEAERNHMLLHDISIVDTTRGITRIKADLAEANGPDLGNSEWVLTGHVQVFMPQGKLTADRATVRFTAKRIASMSAQGAPAEFEHSVDAAAQGPGQNPGQGDTGIRLRGAIESARGHAREIDYDMEHDLLKLNGDAWLSDGCNEITSQSIVYDIVNQKVRADAAPGGDTQVHGTLHARSGSQCTPGGSRP
jgi:lipopolysaccharide export system protein LptA